MRGWREAPARIVTTASGGTPVRDDTSTVAAPR